MLSTPRKTSNFQNEQNESKCLKIHLVEIRMQNYYTLCAVSYPAMETAECAFLNGFMVIFFFFFKHHSNVCNLHYRDLK